MKIRLQAGIEPSTLGVQRNVFLHFTHFATTALPVVG